MKIKLLSILIIIASLLSAFSPTKVSAAPGCMGAAAALSAASYAYAEAVARGAGVVAIAAARNAQTAAEAAYNECRFMIMR